MCIVHILKNDWEDGVSKHKPSLQRISSPLYRYWHAFYLAFYSQKLYIDVVKRWRGFGLSYLLLLFSVLLIPLSFKWVQSFNQHVKDQIVFPLKKLPPLHIEEGHLMFSRLMPYLIHNAEGDVVMVVDTTGQITPSDVNYPNLMLLITNDTLYFRVPKLDFLGQETPLNTENQMRAYPLSEQSDEVFLAKDWFASSGLVQLQWFIDVLVYPTLVLLFLGFCLPFLFVGTFLTQLIAQVIFKYRLTLKEASRLLAVASTAQLVLFIMMLTFNISLTGSGFFYIALTSVYFSYAIIGLRRDSQQMVFA